VKPPNKQLNTTQPALNTDSLLCALIIAPHSFARNRFHALFEDPVLKRVRGRAKRVRGIIRQLAQTGPERAEIVGQQELEDGRILLRYRIANLAFERTTSLSSLEAAAVNYALNKVGKAAYSQEDKRRVENALQQLGVGGTAGSGTGAP
jgi:hypothetical protein